MSDNELTVGNLRNKVASFVNERAWGVYHSPKNLSMSIAIEAAELMELFQWIDVEESRRYGLDREKRELVEMEVADVAIYLLGLANQLDIDLSSAILKKLKLNEEKYPKEQFKGRYG